MTLGLRFEYPTLSGATAFVVVVSHQKDEDGSILLTPDCASIAELEANVARIRSELDKIIIEAEEKFLAAEMAGARDLFPVAI